MTAVLPTNYTVFKQIVLSGSGSLDLNLPVQIQRRFGTYCAKLLSLGEPPSAMKKGKKEEIADKPEGCSESVYFVKNREGRAGLLGWP